MPALIQKHRSYVLHKQFLKSYSNLQQTILLMKQNLGIDNLKAEYVFFNVEMNDYPRCEEFTDEFNKYIKAVKHIEPYEITNYSGTNKTGANVGGDNPQPISILPDGSSVGRRINSHSLIFWIDVNGPYKKPNRYGFDVFEFRITDSTDLVRPLKTSRKYTEEELKNQTWADIVGFPCDKTSKQRLNGIGCSWFAVNDINPDDETKKYWDSLPW